MSSGRPACPLDHILGKWHLAHTTSPVWRDKRNVTITYTALPPPSTKITTTTTSSSDQRPQLDDLIVYQTRTSNTQRTMRGVDSPSEEGGLNAWTWRGNGWLKVVRCRWEVLMWEEEEEGACLVVGAQKSLFTPAVLNVCTRGRGGLGKERLEEVKGDLMREMGREIEGLVRGLYDVLQE